MVPSGYTLSRKSKATDKHTGVEAYRVDVRLLNGVNLIGIKAVDLGGNESSEATISVTAALGFLINVDNAINTETNNPITISLPHPNGEAVKVEIFNLAGELMATLEKNFHPNRKSYITLNWGADSEQSDDVPCTLCNDEGRMVNNGLYIFKVTVFYDDGSKEVGVDLGAVVE